LTDCTEEAKDGLEVCEAVELACAELYHFFAELFKDNRDHFLLWLKAAMEEENHARLFALLGKLRGDNIESMPVTFSDAEIVLLYVQSLLETVKEHPPTMKEALRVAIDLEGKLYDFFRANVMAMADKSYEKSFLTITAAGSKHLESLQEAYERIAAA
jgi:rubrerythrin